MMAFSVVAFGFLLLGDVCAAYDEPLCVNAGGECLLATSCFGAVQSGFCPTQPSNVKCCVPVPAPIIGTCSSYGGTCGYFYTRCTGLVIGGVCPGPISVQCCKPDYDDSDEVFKHVNKEEGGMFLKGYIPTSGSGVTIATGVDLGQQSEAYLKSVLGLVAPESFWVKVRPYLGVKTLSAAINAGLDPNNLVLTLEEAVNLDKVFNDFNLKRINPYVSQMTTKGVAVMASLTHWCHDIFDDNPDGKCYHSSCPNHLKNALSGKTATDPVLKAALIHHKSCMQTLSQPDWIISRLTNEINFLT